MASTAKRIIFNTGFILNLIATVLLFVSFCSPYWYQSWPRVYSPFKRLGLWEACFAGLILPMDPTQKAYHGCWWVLAEEFAGIRDYIMPYWMIICQVIVTVTLVAMVICLILELILWVQTSRDNRSGTGKKRASLSVVHTVCVITVLSAIIMPICVIVFAMGSRYDRYWMPYHRLNYLSWSYGMAVIAAFFYIFASIAVIIYTRMERDERRKPRL